MQQVLLKMIAYSALRKLCGWIAVYFLWLKVWLVVAVIYIGIWLEHKGFENLGAILQLFGGWLLPGGDDDNAVDDDAGDDDAGDYNAGDGHIGLIIYDTEDEDDDDESDDVLDHAP